MCSLNDILKTDIRTYNDAPTAKQGISAERIRFNTDVMFSVAKRMELPLDKTADLMRQKGAFGILNKAYSRRKRCSVSDIAREISQSLR